MLVLLNSNITNFKTNFKRISLFGQIAADIDYGFSATTSAVAHGYAEEILPNHFNIHLEIKIARGVPYNNSNGDFQVFTTKFLADKIGFSNISWNPHATRAAIINNIDLVSDLNIKHGRSGLLVISPGFDTTFNLGRVYDNSTYGGWGWNSGLYAEGVIFMINIYDAITS